MVKVQEMGEFVRSASSTIEAPVVRRLKEAFASKTTEQTAHGHRPRPAPSSASRAGAAPPQARRAAGAPGAAAAVPSAPIAAEGANGAANGTANRVSGPAPDAA